jgi:hypothetical protein
MGEAAAYGWIFVPACNDRNQVGRQLQIPVIDNGCLYGPQETGRRRRRSERVHLMIETNILIEILRAALQSITTERHGYATTLGQNVIAVERSDRSPHARRDNYIRNQG